MDLRKRHCRVLALGFGDEEERPEAHQYHEGAKEHVGPVAQRGDHVGRGAGDEEAPEPLVGRRDGRAKHSDVCDGQFQLSPMAMGFHTNRWGKSQSSTPK